MKNASFKVAAWVALIVIVSITVSPIQMRPGEILSVELDRALAFGLLATLFSIAYPRHALAVGVIVLIGAGVSELLQFLSPSRHARWDDAAIKTAGAACGLGVAFAYNTFRSKQHTQNDWQPLIIARPGSAQLYQGMTALPVVSRMIHAVYFSQEDGQLRICLKNGEERLFEGVGLLDAEALVKAPSPGRHYIEEFRTKFQRLAA